MIIILLRSVVSEEINFKINFSDVPENMKNHVFGTTLAAVGQKLNHIEMCKNLTSETRVRIINLVSHFDAESNTTIRFNYETKQILFRQMRATDKD